MSNAHKRKKARWILAGVVIAIVLVGMSLLKLGDEMVYFYTPEEAATKAPDLGGEVIKVGGMVKTGSVKWVAETLKLDFTLSNMKGVEIAVSHNGTPPD